MENGLEVSVEMMNKYLESLSAEGKSRGTIQTYRSSLFRMYQLLPEDKRIRKGTVKMLREDLLAEGYAANTVNSFTAAVNGFLAFSDCREYQVFGTLRHEYDIQPELTRVEYLRLLSAARNLGRERVYLVIKLIASTGIMLSQLSEATVEAALSGRLLLSGAAVHIPPVLCEELLEYAGQNGIREGAIFRTRSGREINRSNLNREIGNLADDAQVSPEKCTPMALRRLYQTTQEGIREVVEALVEQIGDHLMEREQSA